MTHSQEKSGNRSRQVKVASLALLGVIATGCGKSNHNTPAAAISPNVSPSTSATPSTETSPSTASNGAIRSINYCNETAMRDALLNIFSTTGIACYNTVPNPEYASTYIDYSGWSVGGGQVSLQIYIEHVNSTQFTNDYQLFGSLYPDSQETIEGKRCYKAQIDTGCETAPNSNYILYIDGAISGPGLQKSPLTWAEDEPIVKLAIQEATS